MLLNLFEIYEKYDYLFAIGGSLLIWAFGFFTTSISLRIKNFKIKNFFRFKKESIDILLPKRHGKLILTSNNSATELIDTFVTKGDMDAAITLQTMFRDIGYSANILVQPTEDKTNNIFCLGGPLSNSTTAHYIGTKFSSLTFGVHKDSQYLSDRNRNELADFIHEDNTYNELEHQIGTIRLSNEEIYTFDRKRYGYVFFAKISEQNDEKGSVYICFGNNSITTLGAIRSFRRNINSIRKITKNRKQYCLLFKCDSSGGILFDECNDLTDKAFIKKN